jgi:hypothetical protein
MFKKTNSILFYIFILFYFIFINSVFWYKNQWFDNFIEIWNSIKFSCSSQCFVVVDQKSDNNLLKVTWNLNWTWVIWYWFLDWDEIFSWEFIDVWSLKDSILNYDFLFKNLNYYSQLSKEIIIVLIIEWQIHSDNFNIELTKTSFFDNLKIAWNDFWKIETLTPYSINLRYWVNLNWTSIITIWYVLFFIIFLIWLFFVKNKKHFFIYLSLYLFLFIWFRNIISYYSITKNWLQNFVFQKYENKTFFELWDHIVFSDKIRKTLNLDNKSTNNCKIYIELIRERPFLGHFQNTYLKPCNVTNNIEEADYLIYYKKTPENLENFEEILNFNDSYLLKK